MATQYLSDLERDALTELVNIAVSGAVSRLRTMVGSEVSLTVPVVEVMDSEAAAQSITRLDPETLVSVRQRFDGPLAGEAMLILNEPDGETLARAVIGEDISPNELQDLHADTLGEVGNVLLLGVLATIGSMLKLSFQASIPMVERSAPSRVFALDENAIVLLIHVNFGVKKIDARGYFSLVLGLGSFEILRQVLAAFLEELIEPE